MTLSTRPVPVRYTADFRYRDRDGTLVVEDVKGMMTRDAMLRISLMKLIHDIDVRLVKAKRRRR